MQCIQVEQKVIRGFRYFTKIQSVCLQVYFQTVNVEKGAGHNIFEKQNKNNFTAPEMFCSSKVIFFDAVYFNSDIQGICT